MGIIIFMCLITDVNSTLLIKFNGIMIVVIVIVFVTVIIHIAIMTVIVIVPIYIASPIVPIYIIDLIPIVTPVASDATVVIVRL